MKIAICDDEKVFAAHLSSYVQSWAKKCGRECAVQTFDSGNALINACRNTEFDAVFLDIAMPAPDGFETAKRIMVLHPNMNLVFVSSKESMVFSSYEYNPLWFVPKSQLHLLDMAMNKIINKIDYEEMENRIISLKIEKNKIEKIDLKTTAYIKSESHYIKIFSVNKESTISYRTNLDNIETQLSKYLFVRCHHSYLINCKNISAICKANCILLNGERVPISRSKMADTKAAFQNYLRSME